MNMFREGIRMYFAAYWLFVNVITFFAFGIDKWKAENRKWRIRESTLIGLACIGGSVGGFLAMHIFRHKTKKLSFAVGVPMILAVQVVVIICLDALGVV